MKTVPLPISRAAALTGVPAWRIRDWERRGLVTPLRKPSGHRIFGESELHRITELRELLLSDTQGGASGKGAHPGSNPELAIPSLPAQEPSREVSGDECDVIDRELLRGRTETLGNAAVRLITAAGGFESLKSALEFALDTSLELTNSRVGTISFADVTRQRYVLSAHRGLSDDYVRGIESWQLDEGLAGRAYSMREAVLLDDLAKDPLVPRAIVHEERLRAYICVPIHRAGRRLGIIEAFSREQGAFGPDDVRAVELVGASIAATLENARLRDELEYFRSQREQSARHWTAQLSRAAEDLQSRTIEQILELAEAIKGGPAVDNADIVDNLRSLASSVRRSNKVTVNLKHALIDALGSGGLVFDRKILLDTQDCDVNVEQVLAWRVIELIESLIDQIVHAANELVSVRVSVADSLEIDVHDDIDRPNRTDYVRSLGSESSRMIRALDGEASSPILGYGTSGVRIRIPLSISDLALRHLTRKEREIVGFLGRGCTNRELARLMFISPKTLQNHLTAIYRKLGVRNRLEAIAFASSYH